jgi:hypothetical protein
MGVLTLLEARWDAQAKRRLEDWLSSTGEAVGLNLEDPYAPSWWNRMVEGLWEEIWEELSEELKEMILYNVSFGSEADQTFEKYRLKGWPKNPPPFFPSSLSTLLQPVEWFRAKLLYAMVPADSTLFKGLRDPIGCALFILNILSPYGASVWLFVLLFFLIDKSDEYQLVYFIKRFKAFQAVGALIGAAIASSQLYRCALGPDMNVEESWRAAIAAYKANKGANTTEMAQAVASASFVGASPDFSPCSEVSPGSNDPSFKYLCYAEPVRIVIVWVAFGILWSGHAWGGKKEIQALEMVRTDLADGALDGVASLEDTAEGDEGGVVDVADSQVSAAVNTARRQLGARRGKGGILPYLLIYDVVVALFSIWIYFGVILRNGYYPNDPATGWKFWTTVFMMRQTYSVLSFPFLVLSIPLFGNGLTNTKMTGYDMHGKLSPTLGAASVRKIYHLREREKMNPRFHRSSDFSAAWLSPKSKKKKGV